MSAVKATRSMRAQAWDKLANSPSGASPRRTPGRRKTPRSAPRRRTARERTHALRSASAAGARGALACRRRQERCPTTQARVWGQRSAAPQPSRASAETRIPACSGWRGRGAAGAPGSFRLRQRALCAQQVRCRCSANCDQRRLAMPCDARTGRRGAHDHVVEQARNQKPVRQQAAGCKQLAHRRREET